jgi:hypothetical protein
VTETASVGYLAATQRLVELTIGRPLRQAEQVVDVFALTAALDNAKDDLHAAIEAEKKRKVRHALRTGHPIRLEVTVPMLRPLERLWRLGVREALAELERAGYNPVRAFADAESENPILWEQTAKLKSQLNGLSVKLQLEEDAIRVKLVARGEGSIAAALADALLKVQGGRSIAAGLVSSTLFSGMGTTFEANESIVGGWETSAVLDGGTCDECETHDGDQFATWAEAQELMPNGGPAVYCLGGDRCRCRLVPQ